MSILEKYNKYKKLSILDPKNSHIYHYKIEKYGSMLQKGGDATAPVDVVDADTLADQINEYRVSLSGGMTLKKIDTSGLIKLDKLIEKYSAQKIDSLN